MEDLGEAIVLDREALDLRLQGHPDWSIYLINLGDDLPTQYDQLGAMEDLNEAIVLICTLPCYLHDLFTRSRQLQDKEELFSLYSQLMHVPLIVSSSDISAARAWVCVAEDFQHLTMLLAYVTPL